MLAFSALVAGSFSLGTQVANEIAPAALNAARFAIAAVVIGSIAAATGKVSRAAFSAPWPVSRAGRLFAAYFVLMFEGLKTAKAVRCLGGLHPDPDPVGAVRLLAAQADHHRRMAAALAVGAGGALWVSSMATGRRQGRSHRQGRGDLFRRLHRPCRLYAHGPGG